MLHPLRPAIYLPFLTYAFFAFGFSDVIRTTVFPSVKRTKGENSTASRTLALAIIDKVNTLGWNTERTSIDFSRFQSAMTTPSRISAIEITYGTRFMAIATDFSFHEKRFNGILFISIPLPKFVFNQTQGSQSTDMLPQVELPQSCTNFSTENTPVRSSTDLPYSACRPLS